MTTWAPVDLSAVLSGSHEVERPTRLRLDDGSALLYAGRLHSLVGEPSAGKSWIAAYAVAETLRAENIALVIDLEDSARLWVDRLRRLGVDDKSIGMGLRYVRPSERINQEGAAELSAVLAEPPTLVILDAMAGALTLHGLDPNASRDVESLYGRLLRPLRESGAAVLVLDHVVKSREGRGRWAAGSERKLSALDGAAYVFDVVRPFGRGRDGLGRLVLAKDRLGEVGTPNDVVAEVRLSDHDGAVSLTLSPPVLRDTDEPFRPTVLMARVSEALLAAPGPLSGSQLEGRVKGKRDGIRMAVGRLVVEGYVTTTDGPRGATLHHLQAPFVEDGEAA